MSSSDTRTLLDLASKVWKRIPYRLRLAAIRHTRRKFTVSVVAVVKNESNEVLVLDHFIRPGASWGLPGGFVEPDESPGTAIRRELKEEAGIELESLELVDVRTIRRHIEILYKATSSDQGKIGSREIRALGWFPVPGLPEEMSRSQKLLVGRIVERTPVSRDP